MAGQVKADMLGLWLRQRSSVLVSPALNTLEGRGVLLIDRISCRESHGPYNHSGYNKPPYIHNVSPCPVAGAFWLCYATASTFLNISS